MTLDELRLVATEAHVRHRALQHMGELAEILTAVDAVKPERLLEIGVSEGGTLWAWGQLGIRQILAVTLPVPGPEWVIHHSADLLFADSHTPEARQWVVDRLAGHPLDVLFIDGDHSYEGAMADWLDYSPLVRPGGLVIFHDIFFGPCPDVARVWAEVSAGRPTQEIHATGPDPAEGGQVQPGAGIITIE